MLRRIVGMKYFNVYGPNEDHKADMRSVVHKAYGQILQTDKVQLFKSNRPDFKDGEQMRDFLYVKDAIRMTLHLASEPLASGLYNLGSGQAHTWVQLVQAIFAALGRGPNIEFVEMPEHLKSKYQYYTCADVSKLIKSGYKQPLFTLAEAVRDYVQGYLIGDKRLGDESV
jgi:ADP-L-glycero-D-manno-heptose 6-epimerase